jgi:hypothetical protein
MTWLYVVLVGIVAAAVPTTVWLKRAGDRAWRIHHIRQRRRELVVRLTFDSDRFTREMRQLTVELEAFRERIRTAMRESISELRDEKGTE